MVWFGQLSRQEDVSEQYRNYLPDSARGEIGKGKSMPTDDNACKASLHQPLQPDSPKPHLSGFSAQGLRGISVARVFLWHVCFMVSGRSGVWSPNGHRMHFGTFWNGDLIKSSKIWNPKFTSWGLICHISVQPDGPPL